MKSKQTSIDRMALNLFIAVPVVAVLTLIYLSQKKVILSP
jgi:hypothetical protein